MHEGHHLGKCLRCSQEIYLVEHNHDLFPPGANALQKCSLALSKGAIHRSHKQDHVTARNKIFGELFMLAQYSIDTRGIDDSDIFQKISRVAEFKDSRIT